MENLDRQRRIDPFSNSRIALLKYLNQRILFLSGLFYQQEAFQEGKYRQVNSGIVKEEMKLQEYSLREKMLAYDKALDSIKYGIGTQIDLFLDSAFFLENTQKEYIDEMWNLLKNSIEIPYIKRLNEIEMEILNFVVPTDYVKMVLNIFKDILYAKIEIEIGKFSAKRSNKARLYLNSRAEIFLLEARKRLTGLNELRTVKLGKAEKHA